MFKFLIRTTVVLALCLLFSTFAAVLTYTRLSYEEPIAEIQFTKAPDDRSVAIINSPDLHDKALVISGDQWRIDASFIKIKPVFNVLGVDAQYRLDRFEGRYKDIEQQRNSEMFYHDLSEGKLFSVPEFLVKYNFVVDAVYGSSAYYDIKYDTNFILLKTQSGLIVREEATGESDSLKQKVLNWLS